MEIETIPHKQPQSLARQTEAFNAAKRSNNCCGRVFTIGGYLTAAALCASGIALFALKRNYQLATGLLAGGGGLLIVDAALSRCCMPTAPPRRRERVRTIKPEVKVTGTPSLRSEKIEVSQDHKTQKPKGRFKLKFWEKKEKTKGESVSSQTGERQKEDISLTEIGAKAVRALWKKNYALLSPVIDKLKNNWECLKEEYKEDCDDWTLEELAERLQKGKPGMLCTPALIKLFSEAIKAYNKSGPEMPIDPESEFTREQIDILLEQATKFLEKQKSKKNN